MVALLLVFCLLRLGLFVLEVSDGCAVDFVRLVGFVIWLFIAVYCLLACV